MTDTFKRGGGGVDPTLTTCRTCGRKMGTRRYVRAIPPERRKGLVAHGALGECCACTSRRFAAGKPPRRRAPRSAPAWREEWEHLREFGTPIHEAAQRLGITEQTITNYERARAS